MWWVGNTYRSGTFRSAHGKRPRDVPGTGGGGASRKRGGVGERFRASRFRRFRRGTTLRPDHGRRGGVGRCFCGPHLDMSFSERGERVRIGGERDAPHPRRNHTRNAAASASRRPLDFVRPRSPRVNTAPVPNTDAVRRVRGGGDYPRRRGFCCTRVTHRAFAWPERDSNNRAVARRVSQAVEKEKVSVFRNAYASTLRVIGPSREAGFGVGKYAPRDFAKRGRVPNANARRPACDWERKGSVLSLWVYCMGKQSTCDACSTSFQ
jgi:hypothetical protein